MTGDVRVGVAGTEAPTELWWYVTVGVEVTAAGVMNADFGNVAMAIERHFEEPFCLLEKLNGGGGEGSMSFGIQAASGKQAIELAIRHIRCFIADIDAQNNLTIIAKNAQAEPWSH